MDPSRRKKGIGGWLFLLLVLAAYGVTGAVDAQLADQALDFFGTVMWKVLPVLGGVYLLLLAADLVHEPTWIKRYLGREAGIKGWLIAVVGGVLATGPIYAWYAVLRDLCEKGMRAPLAAVFLYARAIKLPLLPLMIHYFGIAYTLVLCAYLLGFSIVSGILMVNLEER